MTQNYARLTSRGTRTRAVRLPVLTVLMTFAIAVAAEAFSPMPPALDTAPALESHSCAPALTVGLTSTGKADAGYWLQLVKSDGAAACAVR